MTSDRTRLQIDQFEKALGRLRDVLAMNGTDVVRDALNGDGQAALTRQRAMGKRMERGG